MNPLKMLKTWFDSYGFADDIITIGLISFVTGTWAAHEGFTFIANISLSILAFIFLAPIVVFFLAAVFRKLG